MIAACVPALHPVYDKIVKKISGRKSASSDGEVPPEQQQQQADGANLGGHGFWTVVMKHISDISGSTTDYSRSARSAVLRHTSQGSQGHCSGDEKDMAAAALSVPMRSLEDAADVQHPPEAIWTRRANDAHGIGR